MSSFKVGDPVRKTVGFPFTGTVVSECTTLAGKERYLVDNGHGMLHVHDPKHLVLDHPEYQYLDLLKDLLENGDYREGRNGGIYSLFGRQMRFDLSKGFPLLTTKRLHTKSIVGELIWMLNGDTNTKYLEENGITIWDEWKDSNGDLGPVYGKQWRRWNKYSWGGAGHGFKLEYIDQIKNVIKSLKEDPYGRRHIVTAWNPSDIDKMALPPCHCLFQFHVSNGKLNCQLYQRSVDSYLGLPFNIASYALLTHLVAREVGLEVGEFIHTSGDVHLYANHVEQARLQLTREPTPFPRLQFLGSIFNIQISDVNFADYNPHPSIKAPVSA